MKKKYEMFGVLRKVRRLGTLLLQRKHFVIIIERVMPNRPNVRCRIYRDGQYRAFEKCAQATSDIKKLPLFKIKRKF